MVLKRCQTCAYLNVISAHWEFRRKAGPNAIGHMPGKPCKSCKRVSQWVPVGCLRVTKELPSFRMYYNCEKCAHCDGDWDRLFVNIGLRGLLRNRRRCWKCVKGWRAQPWTVGDEPTAPPSFVPSGCLTISREKALKPPKTPVEQGGGKNPVNFRRFS